MFPHTVNRQTMAEQMAETIQELIIGGELEPGIALPIEPDLASQFGVSRAVVRDATRILMARGLVEVQHGRGVFVTQPDNDAFGDALLLALRRNGASAWDVEQFEQILFPELIALAAANITDEEIDNLKALVDQYKDFLNAHHRYLEGNPAPQPESQKLIDNYRTVILAIIEATHNKLAQQLARPLLRLRNLSSLGRP